MTYKVKAWFSRVVFLVVSIAMLMTCTVLAKNMEASRTVATNGEYTLNNRDFNYYYNGEYYYILSAYAEYIQYMIDTTKPLGEQMYSETQTWQEFLRDSAINTWTQTLAILEEAKAADFVLPEQYQKAIDENYDTLSGYAKQYEYKDVNSYLRSSFGENADYDTYIAYMTDSYIASAYCDSVYDTMCAKYSDLSKDAKLSVNVRHVLVPFPDETDGGKAKAKADAQGLYDEWLAAPTEDAFSELAKAKSTDQGSAQNGGLYEGVEPGQMTQSFNDWCFDESRKAGDSGIVETEYGYHIMYFSAFGKPYNDPAADAADPEYKEWLNSLMPEEKTEVKLAEIVYAKKPQMEAPVTQK